MISSIYWNPGGRSVNEDSISFQEVHKGKTHLVLAVVADGIGGLMEGEVASGYVTEELVGWFYQDYVKRRYYNQAKITQSLYAKVYDMYDKLASYGRQQGKKLGTTCTCLLLWNRQFLLLQIGDSLAYQFRRKKVYQMCLGDKNPDGTLNKCIGSMGFYEPAFYYGKLRPKMGILLCSDGFCKRGEKSFREMLFPGGMQSEEGIERRLAMLGEANKRSGEMDNQSAIYIKM